MRYVFADPNDYFQHFFSLIEEERRAEKDFHLREIKTLSAQEREKLGRTVTFCTAKFEGVALGGFYLYRFSRTNMPEHQINQGDVVLLSLRHPLKDGIEGTVYQKAKRYLIIATKQKLPPHKRGWRLDLYLNDITFQRMEEALRKIKQGESAFEVEVLLGKKAPRVRKAKITSSLNFDQKKALELALSSQLFLLHGPPGTGKTTTLVEAIYLLVQRGKRVLATADSNTAVDNLLEGLIKKGVKAVRIGHPARLKKELLQHSLDYLIQQSKNYRLAQKIQRRIEKIREQQERYRKPTPAFRRGLSDEAILGLARQNRGARGVSRVLIRQMARWIELQQEINKLRERENEIVQHITQQILGESVVCTTTSTAGGELLKEEKFDVVIIDEATQATEPSCLIPLIKAPQVILAGDHKQLPPTILSPKAQALSLSLFERLIKLYPEASSMLQIQYRMNEQIKEFPSRKFYAGKLISAEEVKNIVLSDLLTEKGKTPFTSDVPLVFVDTEGKLMEEQKAGSPSKFNPKEAELVKAICEELIQAGLSPYHIGVITPYRDHEDYLKRILPDLEIKTVDGFQGREKEMIIISLVRSNPNQKIGFLEDLRRLNVALTRAKRKLIIVGDANTLKAHTIYRELIDFIRQRGSFIPLSSLPYLESRLNSSSK